MPKTRWMLIAGGLLGLLLAACGGGDASAPPTAPPTATAAPPTVTPIVLVPTWTPVPTRTLVIRTPSPSRTPRPTRTPFQPPTATVPPATTPFPVATATAGPISAPAPLNPTLVLTAEALNARLAADPSAVLRRVFAQPPVIELAEGQLVLRGAILTTEGTALKERPMLVRADVSLLNGQPVLVLFEAFYTDDTSPYTGDPAPFLGPAQQFLADTIRALYMEQRPDDVGYIIAAIHIADGQMTIETMSLVG